VFAWILVREKILTADNLQKRGWPHQDHCALCNGQLETGLHLSLLCPFAKAVWRLVLSWEHFDAHLTLPSQDPVHLISWWEEAVTKINKGERKRFNGMVIFTLWNLWKERNRRIFNSAHESAMQVASRVKEDIEQRNRALTWRG
jgi:hypothetical protein